jgi:hypothetical protein
MLVVVIIIEVELLLKLVRPYHNAGHVPKAVVTDHRTFAHHLLYNC